MSYTKFILVLKQLRENARLTQKQVAEALNVERSTYAYYERGTKHPSAIMVMRLSKIFNVDYSIFMEAIADELFDNDDSVGMNTLQDGTWEERQKMYELPNIEQNLLLAYRCATKENKEKAFKVLKSPE